jgi:hypothetical protein
MWIFHPLGFASIVNDKTNLGLLARGRFKGDLERLFPGCQVQVTTDRDYRFRTRVMPRVVAQRLAEMVSAIDYPNFKDACPKDRHHVYLDVWSAMWREQTRRTPKKRRGKRGDRPVGQRRYRPYDDFLDNWSQAT